MSRGFAPVLAISLAVMPVTDVHSVDITPIIGYRDGGEVTNNLDQTTRDIVDSNVYGLIIGSKPFDAKGRTYELYYSHQSSKIQAIDLPTATSTTLPLTVDYLQVGGTAPISIEEQLRTFVSGGVGFTYMSPDIDGLDSELRASFSLGIGLEYKLTERLAARLEGRMLATLFNNNSTIFCSGGCTITVNGNMITQFEALAGLRVRF